MLFDFYSLNDTSAYFPESLFLEGKQVPSCRVCREDCILIDAEQDFCPVAFRGSNVIARKNYFSEIGLSASEYSFFLTSYPMRDRILLQTTQNGILLVLGDFLDATGLLLVIRPHLEWSHAAIGSTLLATLSFIGENGFAASPEVRSRAPQSCFSDHDLCEQMKELFFYLNSFCNPQPFSVGLFTGSLRIANFAGCKLECVSLPFQEQLTDTAEQIRLATFLLCVFLSLRWQTDCIRTDCAVDVSPFLRYRVCAYPSMERTGMPESTDAAASHLPFLSCNCFREYQLSLSDRAVFFHAPLSRMPGQVNSCDLPFQQVSFVLEWAEEEELA